MKFRGPIGVTANGMFKGKSVICRVVGAVIMSGPL